MIHLKTFIVSVSAVLLGACQVTNGATDGQAAERPARLSSLDDENVSALKTALSTVIGRTNIELAPIELDTSTTISVLPAPLGTHETHSVAMPTVFNLVLKADKCFAVKQDDDAEVLLDGVTCQPVE